ncbi:HAD hydrolase family protein (plasmid) [Escherichia coli]|uniref:Capsule biosynthesis phosphatase n=1 Tax=Escherichia coli TaxID=562 RepID=A0A2K9RC23_ECOLX|nr:MULTISPECIES: HAD hydrolase family protein [Enterobacteriaceae]AUT31292.1 capsule biosynthesis phosphatase [Escherichia coli]EFD5218441.1 HAD hydrolase family protein [Escherichia coli]EFD5462884.1 HAD hydrolase family protein [Escherichia coli]EFG7468432.1 HAD hydrolase family protein [Escherichia coli]EFJ1812758.1 HAD hydrolase family protein [Escherichia coli]
MKNIIIDLDGTLTIDADTSYENKPVNIDVVQKLREYKSLGFNITILTSRNMRTYEGNIGKINVHTLPIIIEWLNRHNVPYDDIVLAKPWCGFDGFYVDDKSIRPSEFSSLTYEQIKDLLAKENPFRDGGNK